MLPWGLCWEISGRLGQPLNLNWECIQGPWPGRPSLLWRTHSQALSRHYHIPSSPWSWSPAKDCRHTQGTFPNWPPLHSPGRWRRLACGHVNRIPQAPHTHRKSADRELGCARPRVIFCFSAPMNQTLIYLGFLQDAWLCWSLLNIHFVLCGEDVPICAWGWRGGGGGLGLGAEDYRPVSDILRMSSVQCRPNLQSIQSSTSLDNIHYSCQC